MIFSRRAVKAARMFYFQTLYCVHSTCIQMKMKFKHQKLITSKQKQKQKQKSDMILENKAKSMPPYPVFEKSSWPSAAS